MKDALNQVREKINEIDKEMARLFEERMKAVEEVAEYKKQHGIAIHDPEREEFILKKGAERISNEMYKEYYTVFQKNTMAISRDYQARLISRVNTAFPALDGAYAHITVNLGSCGYPIIIGRDLLKQADKFFNLNRKCLIVTDDGVPHKYADKIAKLCKTSILITVKSGEMSKNVPTLEHLLMTMQKNEFDRSDCVIAVGGGVVGDLAGLASALYMRGIDFYNVPTTLLSQVDSSIGGKTAINLDGVKNSVGVFKQPCAVLIDADTLKTLDDRQFSSGLCEAIKMSLTSDAKLFDAFKNMSLEDIKANIEEITVKSLLIKKSVVESDEKEKGHRKILNFGHTFGHCIESNEGMGGLLHGECVALGMLPFCSDELREDLIKILKKVNLPYRYNGDITSALSYVSHDKKRSEDTLSIISVDHPGECKIEKISCDDFREKIEKFDF